METETLALFEQLFEKLEGELDLFAPAETGRTREYKAPELLLKIEEGKSTG